MFDLEEVIKELREEIQRAGRNPWVVGTVTAANTSTQTADVTIQTANGPMVMTGVSVLGNYIPETSHQVFIMMDGNAPVVMPPAKTITSAAPAQVTGLTVTGGIGTLTLTWASIIEADVKWNRGYYQVQVATDAGFSSIVKAYDVAANSSVVTGLTTGTTYHVRVRAIDYVGTVGTYSSTVTGVPIGVTSGDLSGVAGIVQVGALPSLPNGSYPIGTVVFLTTDGKLYRNYGNVWTAAVPAVDVTGTLVSEQLNGTTSGDNLIQNAGFEEVSLTDPTKASGWTYYNQGGSPTFSLSTTQQASGFRAASVVCTSTSDGLLIQATQLFAARPNDVFVISDTVKASVNTPDGHFLRVFWLDSAGAVISSPDVVGDGPFTTSYVTTTGQLTAPANTVRATVGVFVYQPTLTGTFYFDNVSVKKVVTAAQIAPLTITAAELANATVTGGKIANDTITATQIAAAAVTASELAMAAVTADKTAFFVGGGNMITNSSFENSLAWDTNWSHPTDSEVTWASSTTFSLYGPKSAKMTTVTANFGTNSQHYGNIWQDIVRKNENGAMSASFWVKAPAGRTVGLCIIKAYDDGAGGPLWPWMGGYPGDAPNGGTTVVTATATGNWQRVTCTFPKYTGASVSYGFECRYGIGAYGVTWAAGEVMYVDGMQAEMADVPTAYAPKPDEILPETVGTTELTALSVTTAKVAANAITAAKIAANTITAGEIAAGTITATQIAAATITGDRIAVGTITAREMIIGSFDNLIVNPGMEANGSSWPHLLGGGATSSATGGRTGPRCIAVPDGIAADIVYPQYLVGNTNFPTCAIGDQFYFEFWVARASGGTAVDGMQANIAFVDVTGNVIQAGAGTVVAPTSGSYVRVFHTSTAAVAGAVAVLGIVQRVAGGNTGSYLVDDFYMRRMTEGALIVDGTVTATKLVANTITAGQIAAGTITATEIASNTITAQKLVVGSFDNLVANPGLEMGTAGAPHWLPLATYSGSGGRSGAKCINVAAGSTGNAFVLNGQYGSLPSAHFAAAAGDTFYFELWAARAVTGTAVNDCQMLIGFLDSTGNYMSSSTATTVNPSSGTYTKYSISSGPAPAGTAYAMAYVNRVSGGASGATLFDDFYVRRMTEGSIILDGTLTAGKIAAGAITTEKITVAAIGQDSAIVNGGFEEGATADAGQPATWTYVNTWGTSNSINCFRDQSGPAYSGSWHLKINPGSGLAAAIQSASIPCAAGELWYMSVWVKKTGSGITGFYTSPGGNVHGLGDPAWGATPNLWFNADISTSWVKYESQFYVPAGNTSLSIGLLNYSTNTGAAVLVDSVELRKVTVGAQIIDLGITTQKLAAGAVTANKITAGTITSNEIAANTITGNNILAGTITAANIASYTISTTQLMVGSFDNLIQNPGFEQSATVMPHNALNGASYSATGGRSGAHCLNVPDGAVNDMIYLNNGYGAGQTAAAVGDQFYFEFWAARASGGVAVDGVQAFIAFGDAAGSYLGGSVSGVVAPTSGTYQKISVASAPAPAGTATVLFAVQRTSGAATGTTLVDDFYARRMTEGSIIVDGTITATKIAASTITTNEIAANTILAGDIAANQITGTELAALNLTVGKYIRSTSFVTGNTGWTIEADGSAEFNNLIIRGIVTGANTDLYAPLALANPGFETNGANTNIMPNGTFDVNATGWSATNATLSRVTTPVQAGAGALQIQASSAAVVTVTTPTGTSGIPINPLSTLALTGFMRSAATTRLWNVALLTYNAAGALQQTLTYPNGQCTPTSAGYVNFVSGYATSDAGVQFTVDRSSVYAAVRLTSNVALANAEIHYLDTVALSEQFKGIGVTVGSEGTVLERNTGTANSGSASLRVFVKSATQNIASIITPSGQSGVPIVPGQAYRWNFALRGDGIGNHQVYATAYFCDASGGNITFDQGTTVGSSPPFAAWRTFSFVTRAPTTNAAFMWLTLNTASMPNNNYIYVDDISVTKVATVTGGFVDGDFVGSRTDVMDMTGLLMPVGGIVKWSGTIASDGIYGLGNAFVPTGGYSGSSGVPPGFLLKDGSAVSRSTYWRLYGLLGTKFGVGDGSTTFNLPGDWNTYTPAWTGATTNPSIGNGTLVARYKVLGPRTVAFRIFVIFGSTTNGGSGVYTFGLPFGAAATVEQGGNCKAFVNPGTNYTGSVYIIPGTATCNMYLPQTNTTSVLSAAQNANAGGGVGTGIPLVAGGFTWINGMNFGMWGTYETAADVTEVDLIKA